MSQTATDCTLGANLTGTNFRTELNTILADISTTYSGTSAPSYKTAGMLWLDTSGGATAWVLKLYDGTDSISLGTFNTTANTFVPQGAMLQDGSTIYAADASGTDTYAITLSPAPSSYTTGMMIVVKFGTANTGACTINVNSLGAKAIKTPAGADPKTGAITANQFTLLVYDGTNFVILGGDQDLVSPGLKYYRSGCVPAYASAATITIGVGTFRDSTNAEFITVASPLTLDITASGANGLDTGAEGNSTWYYVYLIKKSSDGTVASLFSTTNEAASGSVTLPSGYDLKKQLPIAVYNNSSGNFLPFEVASGWPYRPLVLYRDFAMTAAPYSVLAGGTATTAFSNPGGGTNVSCTAVIPAISQVGLFVAYNVYNAGSGTFVAYMKEPDGASTEGQTIGYVNHLGQSYGLSVQFCGVNSSRNVAYRTTDANGAVYISVQGFVVTEVI